MNPQVWWFAARSGGIVAWALVTASVCWGLFLSTRAASKATQPAKLLDLHRFFGMAALLFTGIHIAGLVADTYVHFGWVEVLVPWASEWQASNVAWGVIGFYLLLAVELTSLVMKRLPRAVWRQIHRTSFGLYVFATYHGMTAGSDTSNQWYRMVMLASINVVAFLTILAILAHRQAGNRRIQPVSRAEDREEAQRPRPMSRSARAS